MFDPSKIPSTGFGGIKREPLFAQIENVSAQKIIQLVKDGKLTEAVNILPKNPEETIYLLEEIRKQNGGEHIAFHLAVEFYKKGGMPNHSSRREIICFLFGKSNETMDIPWLIIEYADQAKQAGLTIPKLEEARKRAEKQIENSSTNELVLKRQFADYYIEIPEEVAKRLQTIARGRVWAGCRCAATIPLCAENIFSIKDKWYAHYVIKIEGDQLEEKELEKSLKQIKEVIKENVSIYGAIIKKYKGKIYLSFLGPTYSLGMRDEEEQKPKSKLPLGLIGEIFIPLDYLKNRKLSDLLYRFLPLGGSYKFYAEDKKTGEDKIFNEEESIKYMWVQVFTNIRSEIERLKDVIAEEKDENIKKELTSVITMLKTEADKLYAELTLQKGQEINLTENELKDIENEMKLIK